jgi:hypothetical protein
MSGSVVASPAVSTPFASSQVAANMPQVPVLSGDTCAFSDDQPLHQSPLLPHADAASSTGAGMGSVSTPHHPNAGGR